MQIISVHVALLYSSLFTLVNTFHYCLFANINITLLNVVSLIRYENAFLISLVGLRPEKYFWIGLSNTERLERFQWSNGDKVKFTHFNVGMPGMSISNHGFYETLGIML